MDRNHYIDISVSGIFVQDGFIEGRYRSGSDAVPMYLIREDLKVTQPKMMESIDYSDFSGNWTGEYSNQYSSSSVYFQKLFDDLVYFDIFAINGGNTGGLDGFAFLRNGQSVYYASNEYSFSDYAQNPTYFSFSVSNNILKLNAGNYTYACGNGVRFKEKYARGDAQNLSALKSRIVDNYKQDELLLEVMGTAYDDFVGLSMIYNSTDGNLDGKKVKIGVGNIAHLFTFTETLGIISNEVIYVAIWNGGDQVHIYTNIEKYKNTIPKCIEDHFTNDSGLKGVKNIVYHYNQPANNTPEGGDFYSMAVEDYLRKNKLSMDQLKNITNLEIIENISNLKDFPKYFLNLQELTLQNYLGNNSMVFQLKQMKNLKKLTIHYGSDNFNPEELTIMMKKYNLNIIIDMKKIEK